ncbi:helix-turn-helix transcriptional regulator [Methylobacterium pseudosasicola]|uniref:DNA-binding transcriptional regulator, CsgD family n=1 Tax=Methylobacterium pseudosasicola TaxID=582667 RepID=A0A1I4I2V3_9HYPH|nr:helix-turn-helix transcriptional regulator [Methylobacterium pseudosasicola]SFL48689.1 DNA-binding transcriptional regulator, CsgD family [Methylobacterium pseudosasicola]
MIAISDRDTRPACGFGAPRSAPDPVPVEAALHLLIEHFEQGVAVTDRSGRALFLNRAAQDLIRKGLLRLQNGCLCSGSPEHGAAIARLIARCAIGAGCCVRLAGDSGTLLIAACAIPSNAVLLRVLDPASAPLPDPGVLQDQFGFTPAEAALATDILAGNDLAASAARRRITLHTARAHLRRLFEKTGTRRQAELMRLLLLCPLPIPVAARACTGPVEFKSRPCSNE